MERIKIVQIITRLDWGGSPDIIRMLCESLDHDKYEIKLIIGTTRHPAEKTRSFLKKFKDNIIVVPWLKREINPFFDFLALFNLYLILIKEKFDIVHTHTAKAGALGRLAAHLAGNRRVIHMPHGNNFYGYFNFLTSRLVVSIERFLSKYTSMFIALSELEKKELMEYAAIAIEKIKVIPSGLDLEFKNIDLSSHHKKKRDFGFNLEQKIIGMVSRLEPIKGPQYFIEAIPEVIKNNAEAAFLIVGEGSLRRKLEDRARELGVSRKVVFAGWREDILEVISFLEVLVQPSLNEAIGRVLLEAQALGIPVIATRVGGIPEVVKDGITGMLIPPKDSKKLALSICQLLENEQKRSEMSKHAREWIDERFSATKMIQEFESLYKEILLT